MATLSRSFTHMALGSAIVLTLIAQPSAQGGPGGNNPPSAPVTVVNTTANPVPVTGSIVTADPFAPGATATRFGPVSVGGGAAVVPPVPDGSVFILKYLTVIGTSNISGSLATGAACQLNINQGISALTAGAIPLTANYLGYFVASEQTFLPIQAREGLSVLCSVTPQIPYSFIVTAGGHFVPAGN